MAQHYPRHRAHYRDYDDDPPRRRYADEDVGPRRAEPQERRGGLIGTLACIAFVVLIIALLPYAWQVLIWLPRPTGAATTTTALPTANMTPFPTQPVTQPGALAATPVPARQPAPTDAPACVPSPGGVDLHVGSDGVAASIGNGQACPEQDMAVENAPAPDYGQNRDATGAWVGPTDAPVPTLAPTQATAFVAQFRPATNNNAFVGYLPGRAPPTPWPTAPGPQPGDAGWVESFK